MHKPDLERMTLEFDLMAWRRRADALMPSSPSWDAAMAMVHELEDEGARLDAYADGHAIVTRIPIRP